MADGINYLANGIFQPHAIGQLFPKFYVRDPKVAHGM